MLFLLFGRPDIDVGAAADGKMLCLSFGFFDDPFRYGAAYLASALLKVWCSQCIQLYVSRHVLAFIDHAIDVFSGDCF